MEKKSVIRKIYLYLFALLGLVLLVIGSVRFINMGLKAWVFTEAEKETRIYQEKPIDIPDYLDKEILGHEDSAEITVTLTQAQSAQLKSLLANNEKWEKRQADFDPIKSRRHQDASINLSLMLVGLPLYLYHWMTIKKETKKNA